MQIETSTLYDMHVRRFACNVGPSSRGIAFSIASDSRRVTETRKELGIARFAAAEIYRLVAQTAGDCHRNAEDSGTGMTDHAICGAPGTAKWATERTEQFG
jgi:hypothetical protein